MKNLKELLTETKNSSIYLGSDYIQGNESKINSLINEGYISFIVLEEWDPEWEEELNSCADYINIDGPVGVLASKTVNDSVEAYRWYISSAQADAIKHDKHPYIICQSEF